LLPPFHTSFTAWIHRTPNLGFARRALCPENDRLELELSEPNAFSSGLIGGFNAHAASILTAVYLANGQDLHMKNSLHVGEGQ